MTIKLWAYKNGSASAKSLRDKLAIKMLKKKGSAWKGKAGDTVINWGSSQAFPNIGQATYLNHPDKVAIATNKLKTQQALDGKEYCLPFETSLEEARQMIQQGFIVVCRTKLTGNSGEGIVIANTEDELVEAPLYTVYKKKVQEFRVHVFDGEVISVQRKARKLDVADDNVNWKVRNLEGGFIFARTGFEIPDVVVESALDAVKEIGLDFGAVDIGWHKDGTYVYEINTACGLDGSNLFDYLRAIQLKLGLPLTDTPDDYVPPNLPKGLKWEEKAVAGIVQPGAPVAEVQGAEVDAVWEDEAEQDFVLANGQIVPFEQRPKAIKDMKNEEITWRMVRPDLDHNVQDNTNVLMEKYAGKFYEFKYDKGSLFKDDDAAEFWIWEENHLVPVGDELKVIENLRLAQAAKQMAKNFRQAREMQKDIAGIFELGGVGGQVKKDLGYQFKADDKGLKITIGNKGFYLTKEDVLQLARAK